MLFPMPWLPHVMEFNLPAAKSAYEELAKLCGLSSARALIFSLRRLRKQLAMPESLSQAGLERGKVLGQLGELTAAALNDPCLQTNPRSVKEADLAALVRKAL